MAFADLPFKSYTTIFSFLGFSSINLRLTSTRLNSAFNYSCTKFEEDPFFKKISISGFLSRIPEDKIEESIDFIELVLRNCQNDFIPIEINAATQRVLEKIFFKFFYTVNNFFHEATNIHDETDRDNFFKKYNIPRKSRDPNVHVSRSEALAHICTKIITGLEIPYPGKIQAYSAIYKEYSHPGAKYYVKAKKGVFLNHSKNEKIKEILDRRFANIA